MGNPLFSLWPPLRNDLENNCYASKILWERVMF